MADKKRGRVEESIFDQNPPGRENPRTLNKKIRIKSVIDVLEARGLDPIAAICDVLPELDPSMKARTLLSLAEFIHPKLGRTEHTGENGGPIEVVGMTKEQRDAAVAAAARADA